MANSFDAPALPYCVWRAQTPSLLLVSELPEVLTALEAGMARCVLRRGEALLQEGEVVQVGRRRRRRGRGGRGLGAGRLQRARL